MNRSMNNEDILKLRRKEAELLQRLGHKEGTVYSFHYFLSSKSTK